MQAVVRIEGIKWQQCFDTSSLVMKKFLLLQKKTINLGG